MKLKEIINNLSNRWKVSLKMKLNKFQSNIKKRNNFCNPNMKVSKKPINVSNNKISFLKINWIKKRPFTNKNSQLIWKILMTLRKGFLINFSITLRRLKKLQMLTICKEEDWTLRLIPLKVQSQDFKMRNQV